LEEISQETKGQEKVELFYQKNRMKLRQEAFGVKQTSLCDWQNKYRDLAIKEEAKQSIPAKVQICRSGYF
jgi:hypothetical protein